jgi:transcriptional regulator with XRE-family HTH domain
MTPTELQAWRKQAGLTQAGLAALLGVAANTVNRWEHGDRSIPPFLHLALNSLQQPNHLQREDHDNHKKYRKNRTHNKAVEPVARQHATDQAHA